MSPVDFEGSNLNLTKPVGWTDEQCFNMPAFKGKDKEGEPFILTAWQPNKEDLEAMNRGEPLYLRVCGEGHPPVSLFTMNPDGTGNF
jgi:hypothetical protein